MKKIGFIDYFLDEWHANNYPAWIRDPQHGGTFDVAYAWAAKDREGGLTTRQWCDKFGVQAMPSQEALIAASDCIVVLSPDHPEQHEALAQPALQSGKPVYVDKTFATSFASAKRMFSLAEQHQTPMYSTSALRYAQEFCWFAENGIKPEQVSFVSARGPGVFANYAIHQLEMIITVMGTGAIRVLASGSDLAPLLVYEYEDGRSCAVNHQSWSGFSLAVQTTNGKGCALDIEADFWQPFTTDLLRFFATGQSKVAPADTCAAMAMVEAGLQALAERGRWVDVPRDPG